MKVSTHRPTTAVVDLPAICQNVQRVASTLQTGTKVFAVVKANAYGHGVEAVTNVLAPQVDGFCVSNIDEAIELRCFGHTLPILVLGVSAHSAIELAKQYDISLTVSSLEWLQLAEQMDLTHLRVHLKVDSGMSRIGLRSLAEVQQAIAIVAEKKAIFEGVFTHFATADQVDERQFQAQLACFEEIVNGLEQRPVYVHASNSATSIWHAATVFDMVRLGNVMYGLNPSGHALPMPYPIQPAMSLVSELVQVKQVPAGTAIGYGATYTSSEEEWIGTVPIGYADGFVRSMQGASVLVDGKRCEIVGRVSMDQITIRLPQAYPIGTQVTLMGQEGEERITAQDWADQQDTIHYEVVCLLSDRIPRLYK